MSSNSLRLGLLLLAAVGASILVGVCEAKHGVDVSQAALIPDWKCLKKEGFEFAIIRCYQSTGHPDPNGPHTVYNAHDGGMSRVDVYMFPCPKCAKSAADQVKEAVDYLDHYKAKYDTFWFDIEGPQYWGDREHNRKWLTDAIDEAKRLGQKIGIYTSASQWDPIMGDWHGGSDHPLWYAHYDNNPSFSDFSPFGGWHKPTMKQYVGNAALCGVGIDKNWTP